ncbi:hypothetical protein BST85_00530 [Aureitalea marina]|uniref:Secretion system C-terminal sorting domain-containing protein n=1 Tax=Aureitalea marina TaxID=930804 RepID=A0A2S7KLN6_9FLAO|nr:hypothetical protein BST85_00530 [Aureitalea marina]
MFLTQVEAQTTFDLDWQQGVNGANASFTIEIDDTVRWTWANGSPHSVTSLGGSTETFDSGIISGQNTEFSWQFTQEGENPYQCDVHAGSMFGTISVVPKLSVQDKFQQNVKFYPNPVIEELTIASLYRLDSYEIYDISGKKVGWGTGEGTYTQLNVSYLDAGVYFMRVYSDDLKATIRLIKR